MDSLQLTYDDLMAEVGQSMGYGRDSTPWGADATAAMDALVQAGLRLFYFPPPTPGLKFAYRWNFLKPSFAFSTVSGIADYDLPEEFGGFEGRLTISSTSNIYTAIPIVGEAEIRDLRARQTLGSGIPQKVAYRPKQTDGTTPQRFELLVWPTPDAAYALQGRIVVSSGALKLSANRPYHLGGAAHSETVKAAVLAAMESDLDNVQGPKFAAYQRLLMASIAVDARQCGEQLGYNGNRSDDRLVNRRDGSVTYNGVQL